MPYLNHISQNDNHFIVVIYFSSSTQQQGAACSVFLATAPELEGVGGLYFNNCFKCSSSDLASNLQLGKKLWKLTEQLIKDRVWKNEHHGVQNVNIKEGHEKYEESDT